MGAVKIGLISLALAFLGGYPGSSLGEGLPLAYRDLKTYLVQQGMDRGYLEKVFGDPRNQFRPDIVRKIATLRKERPEDYEHFLRPEVVARGREYLKTYQKQLDMAWRQFEVNPEVIVAILTVESNLGKTTGKYPVFNVFASLAVMDTPEIIHATGLSRHLLPRLRKKAAWARQELKIFLEYCRTHGLDPYQFHGSWAGAIGYAQFLPSSLVRCGRDGDGDGKVDLFTHADAIASIANYLKKSGFRSQNPATWRRAVLAYNNSDAYADTILTLARWY